ncbi:MAG: mechanosensitive ion channel family protein [Bacteroidetes bacterium SW_9_63_38]|nr:MAG: mechanosensitive ion channel family protein [Bacteroidetes bacterium SW_9_63_38]
MRPPQSVLRSQSQQSVPADTTAVVDRAVDQFSNAFSEALHFFINGEWEALYSHFSSGLVYLTGLFLERGLQALAAFLLLYLIYRGLSTTLFRVLDRSESIEPGLQSVLLKTFRVITLVFIGTIVLDQLGLNVAVLVGGLSIAGIIAGFAARDSLENFISGVTVLVDQPFQVGDYIEIDDDYGQVDEITLRSTRIRTVRNEIIVRPNSQMITERVVNHTKRNVLRVDIPFGIAYKEYPEEAREVLLPLTEHDDRILSEPSPSVVATAMDDSSVDMVLRFYIRDPTQEVPIRWEYTEKVREALREADIEIPFPHQQLFLDEAKAFDGTTLRPQPDNGSSSDR